MKKSTIEYRRGKSTRSPYFKRGKAKKAFRYSIPEEGSARAQELNAELRANMLQVFPRLQQIPPSLRPPKWLWAA